MMTPEPCAPQTAGAKAAVCPSSDTFAFPVSSAQQRLWFLDRLQPGSPLYNIPIAARVQGPLDAALLSQAINQIIRRHEILRTRFELQDGQPIQIVAPSMTLNVPVTDLGTLPRANRQTEALRLASEEAQRPFDLSRLPLARVNLLRFSATGHLP